MKIIKEGNASVKVKVCLVRFDHIASFIVIKVNYFTGSPDSPLPEPIIKGSEPFMVIGPIADG